MAVKLCPDRERVTLAIVAACVVLGSSIAWLQVVVLAAGALFGWIFLREKAGSGEIMPAERGLHGGWFAWSNHRYVFSSFSRPSSAFRYIPGALAPVGRRFLPLRGAGFWRRSRSLAFITVPNRISRLVRPEHIYGRLRSRTSNARATVHFFSLPWNSHRTQLVRRIVVPSLDFSSLFPFASRLRCRFGATFDKTPVRRQRCEEPTRRWWASCLPPFTIPSGRSG